MTAILVRLDVRACHRRWGYRRQLAIETAFWLLRGCRNGGPREHAHRIVDARKDRP